MELEYELEVGQMTDLEGTETIDRFKKLWLEKLFKLKKFRGKFKVKASDSSQPTEQYNFFPLSFHHFDFRFHFDTSIEKGSFINDV